MDLVICPCIELGAVAFGTMVCPFMCCLQTYGHFRSVVGSRRLDLRKSPPPRIRGAKAPDIRTRHIRWKIRNDTPGIFPADTPRDPQRRRAQSRGPYAMGAHRPVPSSVIRRLSSRQLKRRPHGFARRRFGAKPMGAWYAFSPTRVYLRSIGAGLTSYAGNCMGGNALE